MLPFQRANCIYDKQSGITGQFLVGNYWNSSEVGGGYVDDDLNRNLSQMII